MIRSDVLFELKWDPRIGSSSDIAVAVKEGVVTLSGFVHSYWDKDAAEKAVKRVYGVRGVANDIEVNFGACQVVEIPLGHGPVTTTVNMNHDTDIVGGRNPHFKRDGESTKWLKDMVWSVAERLGYGNVFVKEATDFGGDDHYSFTPRHVPSVDIMDLDTQNDVPYWHTPQDTIDKISPKTLAIVGHTILESVQVLQGK